MKKCTKCNIIKNFNEFGIKKRNPDGMNYYCKQCSKDLDKKYYYANLHKNRGRKKLNTKRYYNLVSNYVELKKQYDKKRYIKLKDKILIKCNEYRKRNPWLDIFKSNKRRAAKLKATPAWADLDKIAIVYQKAKWLESVTGLKYHVDHVIPLQGKNVCGLHIWENLQILEASINLQKHNNLI